MARRSSRREFLATLAAAGAAAGGAGGLLLGGEAPPPAEKGAARLWHERVLRWGQLNLNEEDARDLDVERWLEYYAGLELDGMTVSCGGIVAFYPTRVPFHARVRFLGERDVFGEFAAAARRRGMRVVARLDPTYASEELYRAHPDWFQAGRDGKPVRHGEAPALHRTCMFGPYYSEHMLAIIREVAERYDPDGFYTNGWPGTAPGAVCRCARCREAFRSRFGSDLPDRESPSDPLYRKFLALHLERVLEVWKLWDGAARERRPDGIYIGNLGGSIRAQIDLKAIAGAARWMNADHQDRSGATPLWDCAQQGRVARAVMGGRTVTNVTSAYNMGDLIWRHTSKSPAEMKLWLAQTASSGMAPWITWLGSTPEDRRWMEPVREVYRWLARHAAHYRNRRSLASVGLVWPQRTQVFHPAAPPSDSASAMALEALQGFYLALLEARIPFDLVHDQDLAGPAISRYAALVLPDAALLSKAECESLRKYVSEGGGLVATFETSRYDVEGNLLERPALADLLGVESAAGVEGPLANSYARVAPPGSAAGGPAPARPALLEGLGGTALLPGPRFRLKVTSRGGAPPVLTHLPPYPAFPPEMVYPRDRAGTDPAVIVSGKEGRTIYFPGDVDRTFWRSWNMDLGKLLANAVRIAARNAFPVVVDGTGLVDLFPWETEAGLAIHILNYSNPGLMKGPIRESFPLGPQRVTVRLPEGFRVARVELLRAETVVPHQEAGGSLTFAVPSVADFEVAAVFRG
jgi:putative glycosyl hydrolase-like family 6 (GHL6) protein/glycosyl hydrolase family 42 (putative beta-galactosidase)